MKTIIIGGVAGGATAVWAAKTKIQKKNPFQIGTDSFSVITQQ